MSSVTKLVVVVVVVLVSFWLVTRFRDRDVPQVTGDPVRVQDLPPRVRETIDHLLDERKPVAAIKVYRDATKAGLIQAKAAIDVYGGQRGR